MRIQEANQARLQREQSQIFRWGGKIRRGPAGSYPPGIDGQKLRWH